MARTCFDLHNGFRAKLGAQSGKGLVGGFQVAVGALYKKLALLGCGGNGLAVELDFHDTGFQRRFFQAKPN